MREALSKINIEIKNTEEKLSDLKKKAIEIDLSILENNLESELYSDKDDVQNIKYQLKHKAQLFQKTEEFFNVGRWVYYFENKTLEWSDETYKIFEYNQGFKGRLIDFYMTCIDAGRIGQLSEILTRDGSDNVINQTIITPLGNKKILSFSSSPIKNNEGVVIAIEGLVKDLTDKVTGKNGLDKFFDLSHDLHCIVHKDLYFLKVSPSWCKLLGYSENELLSQTYENFIHPDDIGDTQAIVEEIYDEGSTLKFENRYIKKSGEVVYLNWNLQVDTETELIYCSARDVTESRIVKERLLNDLSEKELLLREIHHRVKNNLQIISSLLSLQAGSNSEEEHLTKLYEDSQNRIQSMAAIHEMFYQSEELDKIEFRKYLEKLVGDLANTFNSKDKQINFTITAKSVYVNLDTAIPLGLLINEVITNSMKHGVDAEGNVKININMVPKDADVLEIMIGDNGVNSQNNILDQELESLGIMLINSLVEQVDGEIEQLNEIDGTVFKLTFVNKLGYKL